MINTTECLYLTVTVECTWCFEDPLDVFEGKLPPTNTTLEPGILGPFTPMKATSPGNEVSFNAVPGKDVPCKSKLESKHRPIVTSGPHTITVG